MAGRRGGDELAVAMELLQVFRGFDPDMPIQYALSFLTIAGNENMSMGDLAHRLGIAQSSASRNIAALSKWHSFNKAGLDLVEAREDPRERRRKLVQLTPLGHELVARLKAILADGVDPKTDASSRGVAVATRAGGRRPVHGDALIASPSTN